MGKGKVHYIEVLSNEEDDGEEENLHSPNGGQNSSKALDLQISKHAPLQEGVKMVTIATFSGFPKYLPNQGHYEGTQSYITD